MKNGIKSTTPGEFIVTTNDEDQILVVATNEQTGASKVIANCGRMDSDDGDEFLANAALFATSRDMLDALIEVQTELNTAKVIDIEKINEIICQVFAKLANEAGEEL